MVLNLDNYDHKILYLLERGANFVWTGKTFANDVRYRLRVAMDFSRNRWSATLDNILLTTNQPLTTANTSLNLGDIDAAWFYGDRNNPGDNLMAFDNYEITRESPPQPVLSNPLHANRGFSLRLTGEPGRKYALEASSELKTWLTLRTNTTSAADGVVDFSDTDLPQARRLYRARLVPE